MNTPEFGGSILHLLFESIFPSKVDNGYFIDLLNILAKNGIEFGKTNANKENFLDVLMKKGSTHFRVGKFVMILAKKQSEFLALNILHHGSHTLFSV